MNEHGSYFPTGSCLGRPTWLPKVCRMDSRPYALPSEKHRLLFYCPAPLLHIRRQTWKKLSTARSRPRERKRFIRSFSDRETSKPFCRAAFVSSKSFHELAVEPSCSPTHVVHENLCECPSLDTDGFNPAHYITTPNIQRSFPQHNPCTPVLSRTAASTSHPVKRSFSTRMYTFTGKNSVQNAPP